MDYAKIKYNFIAILLVFIFTESCSTSHRGLFEKRKHLKGWHFHKPTGVSPKFLNAPNDVAFKEQNENKNVRTAKRDIADIDHLKIRKLNTVSTDRFEGEIADRRASSRKRIEKLQENADKQRRKYSPGKTKKSNYETTKNTKKSGSSWTLNGAYFFLFIIAPLLFKKAKRKQVQAWSARNKRKSRALLVAAKAILAATSITLGFLVGTPFSLPLLLLSVGLLTLSLVLSEYWNKSGKMTQKKNLGMLGVVNTSTSYGFFALGGMLKSGFDFSQWSTNCGLMNAFGNDPDELVHHPIYIITAMFILILITGILIGLIAWLSCHIYCGSSEVAGVLVFVIGGSAVLFFALLLSFKLFERKDITEEKKKKRRWWSALITLILGVIVSLGMFL